MAVDCTQVGKLMECALLVVANAERLREWVHGDETTDVLLGGKLTPTIRKLVATIDARESAAAQKVIDAGIVRIEQITDEHIGRLQDEGEKIIDRAEAEADRAAEEAQKAALAADMGIMEAGVHNLRKPFVVEKDVKSGEILVLPGHYYPTRDVLFLGYGGVICTPRKSGVEPWGEYQYEEIGDNPNVVSDCVRVNFDIPAGSVIDMWVVSSAAGRNLDELTALVNETAGYRDSAALEADRAERAADMAEVCAGCSGAEVWWTLTEDVPAGSLLTFPDGFFYLYNKHHLHCTNGGVFVSPLHYQETGSVTGEKCTGIIMGYALKAGDDFHAWVTPLGSGSGEDLTLQMAELAELVRRQQEALAAQQQAIDALQKAVDELKDYHEQTVYTTDSTGQSAQIFVSGEDGSEQAVYTINRSE